MSAYAGTIAADQAVERPAAVHTQVKATVPGAAASVWCGVIGFFLFGIILGGVAIGKAAGAKKLIEAHPDRYTGSGLATTGMVLGVIDIIGAVVTVVVMMGQ